MIEAGYKDQAEGAIPNGTRVQKCRWCCHDSVPAGTTGTVLGSKKVSDRHGRYRYDVQWDGFTMAERVRMDQIKEV